MCRGCGYESKLPLGSADLDHTLTDVKADNGSCYGSERTTGRASMTATYLTTRCHLMSWATLTGAFKMNTNPATAPSRL
jgi:hypothetical protein